ncbi:MAG: thioredoxin domain-containing protein [Verrucomicrobia bacterium]|nr:thioredoxin domain-containing protein [Verrucomicrobiota bacterium]
MSQNLLAAEKSPYLLQHKDNPVAWRPWGEAAFAEARRAGKPVFLSIGYSTCHWCHVMAHESFENEPIAAFMNEHFINIKVDREERPDVDRLYMAFVQATTGSGGWPMSVWLTPEGQPFFGGTYFPPESRYGRAGFPDILRQIAKLWADDRSRIEAEGSRVVEALREMNSGEKSPAFPDDEITLARAYERFASSFDEEDGGFGGAPKFPRPSVLNFLLRYAGRADLANSQHAIQMALFTLRKMAEGGMRDHLGGGFHRYSVDRHWHVPHFEKMLYDQAQLIVSYTEAWQISREEIFGRIARETADYVLREMTHADGGFFSAEDADSLLAHGRPEHAEGAFYVWTHAEILGALGNEAGAEFCRHYGVLPDGNASAESDPQGEFRGKNILIQREPGDSDSLAASRAALFHLRAARPRPHLDDKILTAWNGLMISALAKAGAALQEPTYIAAAAKAALFMESHLTREGRLLRSWRHTASDIPGFAEDYAFFIQGLIDLYEATLEESWIVRALGLQTLQDELFWDEEGGSYFSSAAGDPLIAVRLKDDYDGAEPSANSISALNLLRLARAMHDDHRETTARRILAAHRVQIAQAPTAVPQMLVALDLALTAPAQAVIVGRKGSTSVDTWMARLHRDFAPRRSILRAFPGSVLTEDNPALSEMASRETADTALYLCENFTCQAPAVDPSTWEG